MFKQTDETIGVRCYTYLVLENQWSLPLHRRMLKVSVVRPIGALSALRETKQLDLADLLKFRCLSSDLR